MHTWLYFYSRQLAGCLITALSSGDADALCTQALWAGGCKRRAVAAATVHRLRLPAPAKKNKKHTSWKCAYAVGEIKTLEMEITSQMWPPPAHPFSPTSAAPSLRPAPPGGWRGCYWERWCVTAECIRYPVMTHRKHHLHTINITPPSSDRASLCEL